MSQPDLLARIREALRTAGVDGHEFERAASTFLRDPFPSLSPVSGGTDFGRDGDALEAGSVVRLLATTAGDARQNLREGLRRMKAEGVPFYEVVMATSQVVSATRRRQLEGIAEEYGAHLLMVYDAEWLVGELYRDEVWRERLLGVTGQPPALVPVSFTLTDTQLPTVELAGRESELQVIRSSITDVVVAGASGMGKTRLVAELESAALVTSHSSEARISDDIRRLDPKFVVVDDAHDHLETLRLLRHIRRSELSDFCVIATTWPEHSDLVSDHLPGSQELRLPPLERPEGAQILDSLRIAHKALIGDILNQAEGRPGWILLLGDLARQEGIKQVVSGQAVIDQVGRFTRRFAQGEEALDLLARMAALGQVQDPELPEVGAHIGLPEPQVSGHLRRLARHGLTEWRNGAWKVRPPRLRAALVANYFFSRPPSASIEALLEAWPYKRVRIVSAVVDAALVGSEEAQVKAMRLLDELGAAHDLLGDEVGDLLERYCLSGPRAAELGVELVKNSLPPSGPPIPDPSSSWTERLEGGERRARWARAAAAANAAARKFGIPSSFDLLAEMALCDHGPTNHSDHPRSRLLSLPTDVSPEGGTSRRLRQEALGSAIRLLDEEPSEEVLVLAAQIASAAMSPQGRGTWSDPVDIYKLTIVESLEGRETLEWMGEILWPSWQPYITDLSDEAIGELLDLVRSWLRVARPAGSDGQPQPGDERREVAVRQLKTMMGALRHRCCDTPGPAIAWNELLGELPDQNDLSPIDVNARFEALLIRFYTDSSPGECGWEEAITELAADFQGRNSSQVALELEHLLRSSQAVGNHVGTGVSRVLEEMGRHGNASGLLVCVVQQPQLWHYAGGLARLALVNEGERWSEWVPTVLADPHRRGLAVGTILETLDSSTPAAEYAVQDLGAGDAWQIEYALMRRGAPDPLVEALLTHSCPVIRAATCLEFRRGSGMRHGLELPEEWKDRWRSAFLDVRLEVLDSHNEWRFREIAKQLVEQDPELLTEWFLRTIAEPTEDPLEGLTFDVVSIIGELPRDRRREILYAAQRHPMRRWIVCASCSVDPEFAAVLIDEHVVQVEDIAVCIDRDTRGMWFETVAPHLVARGVGPLEVAWHLQMGTGMGNRSELCTELADYLAGLRTSGDGNLRSIAECGEDYFRRAASEAAAREREDRIRGW